MFYTDDPVSDFARYDVAQAKAEAKLPICADCGEAVTEYYDYHGDIICLDCMEVYRKEVDVY